MFDINIHCVVFGVNLALNKRCVLSISPTETILPSFSLESDHLNDLDKNIIGFLKNYIFVNDLELIPQHITMHSPLLSENLSSINTVYGFIVDYNSSINKDKCFWLDFDPVKEQKLSLVLLQTMQKLA